MSLVDGNILNPDAWKKDLTLIGLGLPGLSYSKLNTPTPAMLDRGKNLNYLHNIEFLYMVWIMAHFGVTQEGQKTLRLFYSSTMNNIFDTTFLAIYVAIPVNVITQATINSLTRVLHKDRDIPKGRFDKGVKKKWKQMFRTLYGEMYLKVLMEYGRYPNAKKQPLVQKMINSEFGYTGTTQTRRNRNHRMKSTMVKQAVYGIDGMTQVVLYFWPLLFLDEETIDDEIRNLLRSDLNFLVFMHLCKESKELIPESLEGINAYGKCFGIPKNLDVLEKFPDIISGKLDLESFIPETMATTGYVEPKSSKKRKKTTN